MRASSQHFTLISRKQTFSRRATAVWPWRPTPQGVAARALASEENTRWQSQAPGLPRGWFPYKCTRSQEWAKPHKFIRSPQDCPEVPVFWEQNELTPAEQQELWNDLAKHPHAWSDQLINKELYNLPAEFPDFIKKDWSAALWIRSPNAPHWLGQWLTEVKWMRARNHQYLRKELWDSFMADPNGWEDFRADKRAGKRPERYPDFRRTQDSVGLWLGDDISDEFLEFLREWDGDTTEEVLEEPDR